jgi:integrase/recombinase XerD
MFRYAALSHPEHAAVIQRVLAIPTKRGIRTDVSFLEQTEVDALLAAPDRGRWIGRRDHALLVTAIQTGLRVSELTGLRCQDVNLDKGAHVRCLGKGRKQRCTPLTTNTIAVLRVWLQEREGEPQDHLFPTSTGRPLTRDAIAWLVTKYTKIAQAECPTLKHKTVTPHVLRHSAAMNLLRAGCEATLLALWLGHESVEATQVYTPTSRSKNGHWHGPHHWTPHPVDTGPKTPYLRSLRASDYAELSSPIPAWLLAFQPILGIIRNST